VAGGTGVADDVKLRDDAFCVAGICKLSKLVSRISKIIGALLKIGEPLNWRTTSLSR